MRILAFETSCDETAVAIYQSGVGVTASVLHSQIAMHAPYGGVVPEIASRSHADRIEPLMNQALINAKCTLHDIDLIAVTNRPGLPGSLLIGVSFAKGIAAAYNKPIIGIDHLEGHVYSAHLEHSITFPTLCLTASGGHTALYIVHGPCDYEVVGHTHDDAAGEAFDKIAKLMHLSYPGGPEIEKLAREVNFVDFFAYPRLKDTTTLDMSFSGLKTAVLYHLTNNGWYDIAQKKPTALLTHTYKQQVASSFLVCIGDIFIQRITMAIKKYPQIKSVNFVGGVACNRYLKDRISAIAAKQQLQFAAPSPKYCTDNAAMIAYVASLYPAQEISHSLLLDIG